MNIIQNANIKNKKVLLRVDFNVPLKNQKSKVNPSRIGFRAEAESQNVIQNDKRIKESLPTINYLLNQSAEKITIIAHLGKPKGRINEKYSLWPIANYLSQLLSFDTIFSKSQDRYNLSDKISLLENLRFDSGEETNDAEFAKRLASMGDIFVNDAFGACHRDHASIVGVAKILPSYAGFLIQEEIKNLNKLLKTKENSFTIILGGSKISDKLPVLKAFSTRAQNFLIGGAIANTFLAARRHYLGKSLVEPGSYRDANIVWQNITDEINRNIFLPVDLVISRSIEKPFEMKIIKIADALKHDYLKDYFVVDIGPKTIEQYQNIITRSKTIFWNGNMGISEVSEFANGTKQIAELISKSEAHIVIGGGDTVAACEAVGVQSSRNIFFSTGGGATEEFLAGKELPGLKVLGYYKN